MTKIVKITAFFLLAATMLASCNKNSSEVTTKIPERKAIESTELQFVAPKNGDTVAIFDTSMGTIKAILYPEHSPQAVENFIGLANEGYYDGLIFHRVVKDFVIQSGDDTATGAGGTTIWDGTPFSVEVSDKLRHYAGALAVARVGDDLNSCKSQFYFVSSPQNSISKDTQKAMADAQFPESVVSTYAAAGGAPALDGQYTVFGQVYEGLDVVDAIGNVKTDLSKPIEDIIINSIKISILS